MAQARSSSAGAYVFDSPRMLRQETNAPALLERACAKLNAASALPSYTGLKNAILAIKSSDAEERAKGRPVGAAGSGELVDRAKSAGRLRGADAYKRGGE